MNFGVPFSYYIYILTLISPCFVIKYLYPFVILQLIIGLPILLLLLFENKTFTKIYKKIFKYAFYFRLKNDFSKKLYLILQIFLKIYLYLWLTRRDDCSGEANKFRADTMT